MPTGLPDDELTVLRALYPTAGRSAEDLALTTPFGVPALLQHLQRLRRRGYAEVHGPATADAATTEYLRTRAGTAAARAQP
jgi:hypothetical protein